ncbi:hypothetical protein QFZ51_002075 [Chitinophaga sp. W3I9]|uniref:hypothetical protein n=1 Tax=Chitinophaga sp. W3I9 TaxID=3373924 RepID=UPI003D20CE08
MKKFLCLLMLTCYFRAGAQVSMTVQLPPAGVLLKAQLWNIVLVSASNATVNVRITMRFNRCPYQSAGAHRYYAYAGNE